MVEEYKVDCVKVKRGFEVKNETQVARFGLIFEKNLIFLEMIELAMWKSLKHWT